MEFGNFKDDVKLVCSDDKPAMHNAETIEALRKIHPTGAADQKHPKPPHMNSLQVTRATVSQVIMFSPHGSSVGHDGLTPQHIKDMTCNETNSLLVEVITDFVNLLCLESLIN